MNVKIYYYKNGAYEEYASYGSRKEFIAAVKELDAASNSDDYNKGIGVKNFLDACDCYIGRDGNYKIESGKEKVYCKKSRIYVNGKPDFISRA